MSKLKVLGLVSSVALLCSLPLHASVMIVSSGTTSGSQYSLSSSSYTQNFDTLSNSNGGYANGGSKTWTDNTTLPNWYAAAAGGVLNTSLVLTNGAANPTNRLSSFGADGSSDRALGANSNGNAVTNTYLGLAFQNSSGSTLDSFTIGYTGEQWRENTNARTQTMVIEYKIGATSGDLASASGWSVVTGSTYSSSTTLGVSNGSLLGSSVISPITVSGLSLADGQSIWFRWNQTLVGGTNNSEDSIAIDDVNVSFVAAAPVPEPATYAMLLGSAGVVLVGFKRWRSKRR